MSGPLTPADRAVTTRLSARYRRSTAAGLFVLAALLLTFAAWAAVWSVPYVAVFFVGFGGLLSFAGACWWRYFYFELMPGRVEFVDGRGRRHAVDAAVITRIQVTPGGFALVDDRGLAHITVARAGWAGRDVRALAEWLDVGVELSAYPRWMRAWVRSV